MKHDLSQTPVAVSTPEGLTAWNGVNVGFLSHGRDTPIHLAALLEAEPNCTIAHAARGLFSLMMGKPELVAIARQALADAEKAAATQDSDPRSAAWLAALTHWLNGSPTRAISVLESSLARHKQDTLTAKVSHAIRFILGDAKGMRASVERALPAHDADHPLRGYLLGCHAFTLEETGDYARAEATGLEGLTLAPNDAWGLHAVAHVHDMRAAPDAGIALIEENTTAWDHSNNFRYHVWWHKALLHLDRGEYDVALGLYDTQIRVEKTDDYRDISNATSLLMRLELEGVDVGPRWEELSAYSANRVGDGCLVFADLHYMLALSGAQDEAAKTKMRARFARDAKATGEMPARVAHPGLAAIEGLNAFAEGRYGAAFTNLAHARPAMQTIGGSHAQRDVFERITIDAGLRAGHISQAEAILRERLALRGGNEDRFAAQRFAQITQARAIPAE